MALSGHKAISTAAQRTNETFLVFLTQSYTYLPHKGSITCCINFCYLSQCHDRSCTCIHRKVTSTQNQGRDLCKASFHCEEKPRPISLLWRQISDLNSQSGQGLLQGVILLWRKTPTYFSAVRTEISLFFLQFRWSGSEVENAFELHIFLLNISNVPVKEKLLQLRDRLLHITRWTNTQQIYINNRH